MIKYNTLRPRQVIEPGTGRDCARWRKQMKTIHELIEAYLANQDKELMKQLLEQVQTEEHLWSVLARPTNNFYMGIEHERPAAYLFTDKQFSEEFMKELKWEGLQVKSLEIRPVQRMNFFVDLYRSGFEIIAINKGQDCVEFSLKLLIEKPEQDGQMVMNPSLMRAAAQFYQGLATKKVVKSMQDIMCLEIRKAEFILPVDCSSLKEGEAPGDVRLVENRPGLLHPLLEGREGVKFYPVFTDWMEFGKYNKKKQYGATVVKFEALKRLAKKSDGVALNPFGFNLVMDKEKLEAIAEV